MEPYRIWECLVCGWVYDESKGWPDDDIAPGTRWEDISDDWLCPDCGVGKEDFEMVEVGIASAQVEVLKPATEPKPQGASGDEKPFQIWECLVCGYIYDEAKGAPGEGLAPGTRWEDIPDDWLCPDCGVGKEEFEMVAVSRHGVDKEAAATTSVMKPLVIIGSGLAGYNLAREFRKLDKVTPLIIITSDDGRFYSKPLISTGYHKGKTADDMATASAGKMSEQLNAQILTFTEVKAINRPQKVLQTSDGDISYGKLVLATGARCVSPPLDGNGLEKVYSINNLLDYASFREAMTGCKKVLIIGAGLIGSEYANDLIQSGFEVEVVDPLESVLGTLLPKSASESVATALRNAGVKFHLGTVVKQVDLEGEGVRATLGNGDQVSADIVLSAVGVRPHISLASEAGLLTNRGIFADRTLRTSDPDIYTLGDCAEVDGHVLYYILPLIECARKLAKTLTGEPSEVFYPAMPVTVKTTLFPVVVSPPPRNASGDWIVEAKDDNGVRVLFRDSAGQLLGFALTGNCVSAREELAKQTVAIMSA